MLLLVVLTLPGSVSYSLLEFRFRLVSSFSVCSDVQRVEGPFFAHSPSRLHHDGVGVLTTQVQIRGQKTIDIEGLTAAAEALVASVRGRGPDLEE